jgi:HK97 gp10 family phage protein
MSIELENYDGVLESINSLFDIEKIDRALGRACAIVEADAKKKAPKGNGELRRSITSKVSGEEGIIYTPLFYAPYVEYGTGLFAENGGRKDVPWCYQDEKGDWHTTSGMEPHPYMRPALYENREEILRILREGLMND